GRPAAADCDRAGADPERADSPPRRAVGGARRRIRAAGARGTVTLNARPDVDHHRAPPGDDPQRRRDLPAESRGHRRRRHARRTARPQRALRALLPCAVSPEPRSPAAVIGLTGACRTARPGGGVDSGRRRYDGCSIVICDEVTVMRRILTGLSFASLAYA